jgi:hypothetical protein
MPTFIRGNPPKLSISAVFSRVIWARRCNVLFEGPRTKDWSRLSYQPRQPRRIWLIEMLGIRGLHATPQQGPQNLVQGQVSGQDCAIRKY